MRIKLVRIDRNFNSNQKPQEDHKILTTRDWARAITCDNHSYVRHTHPSIHTLSTSTPPPTPVRHFNHSFQVRFPIPTKNSRVLYASLTF